MYYSNKLSNTAGISGTFSRPPQYIGFNLLGWVSGRGWGGWWEAEDRFFHTFEQKSSYCVFIEVHEQPRFTCQA